MPPKKKIKNISINFIIEIGVYPFDVMVSLGQSDKQLTHALRGYKKLTKLDYELCAYPSENVKGRAVMFSTNASIIRLRKLPETPEDYGHMAHEIFHIVAFIMERIGIELKVLVSDEAYAYLIEFLTKEIYSRINKYY